FTPLYGLVMGGIYNLSPELQALAQPAVQLMALLPLLMGGQSVLRGVLIRSGRTGVVRTAMMFNVGTLIVALVIGTTLLPTTGIVLAAVATLAGGVVELVWLYRRSQS
ncbi:MAG: hypothetical protein PVG56_09760, partial [Anaerolineae bacterium]